MDGVKLQQVHFALTLDGLVVPTGGTDLSLLYGLQKRENPNTGNAEIEAIFWSADQGRIWTPLAPQF